MDTAYWGAHVGVGYEFPLNNVFGLDVSAKYIWTHVDSDSFKLGGDRYHMDSMDSHRTNLGVRLNYSPDPRYTAYAGAAWEYEFNGKADGTVLGMRMDEADLGGSTGIFQVGVDLKPSAASPWTFNLGVNGYVGEREGVSGQLKANYSF